MESPVHCFWFMDFAYECGTIVMLLVSIIGGIAVFWSTCHFMHVDDLNGDPK